MLGIKQQHIGDIVEYVTNNTDWWFGTFFIFPYIGNNHPNWLSYFSEGLKPPTRIAGKMCWMMGFAGFSLSVPSVPCMETSPCFLPFAGQNLGTLVFASKQWVKLRKAGCPCSLIIYRGGEKHETYENYGFWPIPMYCAVNQQTGCCNLDSESLWKPKTIHRDSHSFTTIGWPTKFQSLLFKTN